MEKVASYRLESMVVKLLKELKRAIRNDNNLSLREEDDSTKYKSRTASLDANVCMFVGLSVKKGLSGLSCYYFKLKKN